MDEAIREARRAALRAPDDADATAGYLDAFARGHDRRALFLEICHLARSGLAEATARRDAWVLWSEHGGSGSRAPAPPSEPPLRVARIAVGREGALRAATGSILIATNTEGRIVGIDPATLEVAWRRELHGAALIGLRGDDPVLLQRRSSARSDQSARETLVVLDGATGDERCRRLLDLGAPGSRVGGLAGWGDRLVVVILARRGPRYPHAPVDLPTRSEIHLAPVSAPAFPAWVAALEIGDEEHFGDELWRRSLSINSHHLPQAVVCGDTVLVRHGEDDLHRLRLADGEILGAHRVALSFGGLTSTARVHADGVAWCDAEGIAVVDAATGARRDSRKQPALTAVDPFAQPQVAIAGDRLAALQRLGALDAPGLLSLVPLDALRDGAPLEDVARWLHPIPADGPTTVSLAGDVVWVAYAALDGGLTVEARELDDGRVRLRLAPPLAESPRIHPRSRLTVIPEDRGALVVVAPPEGAWHLVRIG